MSRSAMYSPLAGAAVLALFSAPAHAGLTQQETVNTEVGSVTARSNNANSGALDSKSSNATLTVNRFDTSNGVLTGASATLNPAGGVRAEGVPTAVRTGNLGWTLGGATANATQLTSTGTFASQSLNSFSNLSDFTGAGTISGTAAYTVTADRTSGSGEARMVLTNSTITQTVTYSYLQHANASFDGASDTNSLTLTAGSGFNIYALPGSQGAANTTTLDSVSYSCVSGNCGAFQFSLTSFQNLAAGSFVAGTTGLNTASAGTYSANYLFTFTDHAGLGVGQQQNTLSLTLNGTVAAVPEPETYVLMLAGLGAVGIMARRRKVA